MANVNINPSPNPNPNSKQSLICNVVTELLQKNEQTCSGLMKTALNNVLLPTLFKVVNNTKQVVEPETSLQSGVTMLNNIADKLEHCVAAKHCSMLFSSGQNRLFDFCCVYVGESHTLTIHSFLFVF